MVHQNDRLNLRDWVDDSVELERTTNRNHNKNRKKFKEQTASVFTRATMQGMPMDKDFTDNPEMTNAISMSKMIAKTCAIMHAKSCHFSNSLTK